MIVLLLMLQTPVDGVSQELQKLNGTWQVVQLDIDGKDLSERLKGYRYVFEGQWIKLQDRDGKPVPRSDNKHDERPFIININTNPKSIDMTISVKSKNYSSLGIYELKDNQLRMCFSEPGSSRPQEFQVKPGVTLITLQRLLK